MNPKPGGNGTGEFETGQHDMGGWVRVFGGRQDLPDDLPLYLSQAVTEWFRRRPHLHMRCVVPIQRDGNTVELHAWYEAHVFEQIQGPQPQGQG
jgi:hypothetical protein